MDTNEPKNERSAEIATTALLAVISPIVDWYQSDEHEVREPMDILRDIVADLQTDRTENLKLRRAMAKVRDTAIAMRDAREGSVIRMEGPERLRELACESLSR